MIAEFFSNAEYREWLKTVPAPKLKMSMFDKIVDFIARIFTGKSKTAYEQLKPTFDYILMRLYLVQLLANLLILLMN